MGDDLVPGQAAARPLHEVEGAREEARVVLHHRHVVEAAAAGLERVERELEAGHDRADLDVGAARAEHLDALGDDALDAGHVGGVGRAVAVGQLLDGRDALGRAAQCTHVDHVVGAEPAGQLEAAGDAVDGDDLAGAHVPGGRDHVQAEAAGALDDQRVALAEAARLEALDDLAEGAVDRRDQRVGELVRHLDADVAGHQVVVIGEAGHEVGEVGDRAVERAALIGAALGHVAQAGNAAPAGEEVVVDDAVALGERLAGRVCLDALAERDDPAAHLVAERAPLGRDHVLAAPPVEVAAADVGVGDLDQDRARLGVLEREALEVPGPAHALEDRDPAVHGASPMRMEWAAG